MTPKGLSDYILYKLGIESSDFPEMLSVINLKKDLITEKIARATSGKYLGVYGYGDLVADQREYPLPTDVLNRLILVNLKFSSSDNYVKAKPVDIDDIPNFRFDEDYISSNFSNSEPKYFIYRSSVFVLSQSIDDVEDGLQYWYINFLPDVPNLTEDTTDLSVATDTSLSVKQGFPKMFHELLARAVIIDFKEMSSLPLVGREPLFDQDLEAAIADLNPLDTNEELKGTIPYDDGSNY